MDSLKMDQTALPVRSLNIKHALYGQLLGVNIKHHTHTGTFNASLKDRKPGDPVFRHDSVLSKSNLKLSALYPTGEPFMIPNETSDKCLQLMRVQEEYQHKLQIVQRRYKDKTPSMKEILENDDCLEVHLKLPRYLVELSQLKNVDPYFINEGKYDYYFTGGRLTKVKFEGDVRLVSCRHDNQIYLQNGMKSIPIECTNKNVDTIYSLRGSNFNDKALLTIRRKYSYEIDEIIRHEDQSLFVHSIYASKTHKKPFTDVKLIDEKTLATLSTIHELNLIDLEKKKKKHSKWFNFKRSDTNSGALGQIEAYNQNLLFMDTEKVSLFDLKSNEIANTFQIDRGFFTCNDLCLICISNLDPNYVYVASKHSIFKCDVRQMRTVHKWFHLMEHSPIALKVCTYEDHELVFVTSFYETMCLQVRCNENFLPFRVGHIKDTLSDLNSKGQFFLTEPLQSRFEFSICGLEISENSLFVSNSLGDIFKSDFFESPIDPTMVLNEWMGYVPVCEPSLNVNAFKNMDVIKRCITKDFPSDSKENLTLYTEPNKSVRKFVNPAKEFDKYDMFAVWESPRVDLDLPSGDGMQSEHNDNRIESWLQQTMDTQHEFQPPMDNEDFFA